MTDIQDILKLLSNKQNLDSPNMTSAMELIVGGHLGDDEIEKFLRLFNEKGFTSSEITAAVKVMRSHAVKLPSKLPNLLDTCGTGGDNQQTVNVSTLAAIVASSCGAKVAKHGNRSVSSVCGSADILEALGVVIDLPPEKVEQSLKSLGFGFFFAPLFHPAARFAAPARKRIKERTLFNILGPLCNPADAEFQIVGVYQENLVKLIAEVLRDLGSERALVIHSADGLDEISIADKTTIAFLDKGQIKIDLEVHPEAFGVAHSSLEEIRCHSVEEGKKMALEILKGSPSPASDIVALNAGAALYAAGISASIGVGVKMAQENLRNGLAYKKLEEIVRFGHDSR